MTDTQLVLDLLIHVAASISLGAYINPEYKHDLLGMLGKAKDNLEPKVYMTQEDADKGIEACSYCHPCGNDQFITDGRCRVCGNETVREEPGDETLSGPPAEYKGYHPEVDFDKVAKEAMAKVTGAPEDYKVTPVRAGYETIPKLDGQSEPSGQPPPPNYLFERRHEAGSPYDTVKVTGITRMQFGKQVLILVLPGARIDWGPVRKENSWLWDE